MQIHYGDQRIDQFPTDEWKLIERFAQEGLLKQEVWSSRLQWLGVKANRDPTLRNRIQRTTEYLAH